MKTSDATGALYPGTTGGFFCWTAFVAGGGCVEVEEVVFGGPPAPVPAPAFAQAAAATACGAGCGASGLDMGPTAFPVAGVVEAAACVVAGAAPVLAWSTSAVVEGEEAGGGADGIGLTTGSLALATVAVVPGAFTGGLWSMPLPAALALLIGASGAVGGATLCEAMVCLANASAWSRSWIRVA